MNPDRTKFIELMRSEFAKENKLSFSDMFSKPFTDVETTVQSESLLKKEKLAQSLESQTA